METDMISGRVLAIMSHQEPHIKLVQPHMADEMVVIDLTTIPTGTELSCVFDNGESAIFFGGIKYTNVKSVWWRQSSRLIASKLPLESIDNSLHEYTKSAVCNHAMSLSSWEFNGSWVSHPYNMMRADNKAGQLQKAQRLGFRVPDSLHTSDQQKAKDFIERFAKREGCIVKTLAACSIPVSSGKARMFWTTKVSETVSLRGLNFAPAIFQQYISGTDIRVIVVGDMVFAAKITSAKKYPKGVSDWRVIGNAAPEKLIVEPFTVDQETADRCRLMCAELGIAYGALDFILDSHDNLWFLEINSSGAWAFIEMATGQEIGRAVAQLLMP